MAEHEVREGIAPTLIGCDVRTLVYRWVKDEVLVDAMFAGENAMFAWKTVLQMRRSHEEENGGQ